MCLQVSALQVAGTGLLFELRQSAMLMVQPVFWCWSRSDGEPLRDQKRKILANFQAIGVALTAFRRATTLGASFAQRRMLVTLEIPSKDRSYPWFLEWMAHQTPSPVPSPSHSNSGISSLWKGKSPMSLRSHELAVETTYKQHTNGSSEAVFNLVPGPGTHYFRYRGSWFQVKRERDAKLMDLHSGSPWETLTLTTLSSSRHLFAKLLADARRLAEKSTEGKTVVYTAWGVEWRPFGKPRRRREMGSVVLEQGVAERVVDDLRGFLGRGKWYAERGESMCSRRAFV